MANIREIVKKQRIEKIGGIFAEAKEKGVVIDKKKLVSTMIVQHGISKKTATEEIEAVMEYNEE